MIEPRILRSQSLHLQLELVNLRLLFFGFGYVGRCLSTAIPRQQSLDSRSHSGRHRGENLDGYLGHSCLEIDASDFPGSEMINPHP